MAANSNKKLGRIAGVLYLLVGIFGGFSEGFVDPKVYVAGNAADTARNVVTNSELVRLGVVAHLLDGTFFVFLAMTLYVLLQHINRSVARAMLILVALATGIICLNAVFQFEGLRVANDGAYSGAFGVEGSNALVLLLLDIQHYGTLIAQVFFGLWLIPLGYLAYKSVLFPKWLGFLLIVGGACYLVDLLAAFLLPRFEQTIHTVVLIPSAISEISMVVYLLAVGVKTQKAIIILLPLFMALSGQCTAQIILDHKDSHIHYMGRVDMKDSASVIAWPGTSLTINFTGSEVSALLNDERGDNYFNVVVDGKVVRKLHPDAGKKGYLLVSGLKAGKHTLTLFKRTEWENGKTWFYEFTLNNGARVMPAPATARHKLEFFGDSITSGYAVEDSSGQDRGTSPYKDDYVSYAALTARHFGAEFYSTSKSGIGILVSWFPMVMSGMYDRLDATDSNSKWDFSRYSPDIVIVNLFQNDCWLTNMPENEQFKAKFGVTAPKAGQIIEAYADFIKKVRNKYPKAHIICALGNMDATREGSPWIGYIEKAVASLQDKNIYTHFFPYKNTPGHPNVSEQESMAESLIAFIHETFGW